jgi:hypothetical protein
MNEAQEFDHRWRSGEDDERLPTKRQLPTAALASECMQAPSAILMSAPSGPAKATGSTTPQASRRAKVYAGPSHGCERSASKYLCLPAGPGRYCGVQEARDSAAWEADE